MKQGLFKSIYEIIKMHFVEFLYVFFFGIAGSIIYFVKFTDCRIGVSYDADKINEVLVNLSYSYLAAVFFYWVADRIPYHYKRAKIRMKLRRKFNIIKEDIRRSKEVVAPFNMLQDKELNKEEFIEQFMQRDLEDKCYFSKTARIIDHLEFLKKDIMFNIEYLLTYNEYLNLKQYTLLLELLDYSYLSQRIIPKIDVDKEFQTAWNDNQKEIGLSLYALYEKVRKVKW